MLLATLSTLHPSRGISEAGRNGIQRKYDPRLKKHSRVWHEKKLWLQTNTRARQTNRSTNKKTTRQTDKTRHGYTQTKTDKNVHEHRHKKHIVHKYTQTQTDTDTYINTYTCIYKNIRK